jgi:ABC-type phosphate/phosphonate transport system substrate-binding protein
MIAALPMYDWPALRAATDAFWAATAQALATRGLAAPPVLSRPAEAADAWADPELLIGQACGMPYVSGACGDARVIAKPDYGLAEAGGGRYRSVIVAPAGAAGGGPAAVLACRRCRVAVNEWGSYSGHIALRAYLAGLRGGAREPFFGAVLITGSHVESARAVAEGAAEIAALDSVIWALLGLHEPETAARLCVLDRTPWAPALPFITAPRFGRHAAALARALAEAAAALPAVPGLPRAVAPAGDADYAPIRAAARLAAREAFAPGAPAVPTV